MTITTRKPTCRTAWPFILLAGVEGGGKTWAAVETSAMDQIDRTFFLELGEGMADEYGQVPGADFEIIEHDGTVGQVREAIAWAAEQPAVDGKHNLLIFDSLSELWALLSDNAQAEANRRQKRKGRQVPEDGAQITMDLWNRATEVWEGIISQLQRFPGPVVGTARLDQITLVDGNGQPTKDKDWKIQAQKRLPFRASVIVQARQPRQWTMTKIATTVPELQLEPGKERTFNDFSVPKLLTTMGVGAQTEARNFQGATQDDSLSDEAQERERIQARERELEKFAETAAGQPEAALHQALNIYGRKGENDKVRVIQAELKKREQQQATETVQEVLDAEIVEEGTASA